MNTKFKIACLALTTLLTPALALAVEDSDSDRSRPMVFVKDSAITAKIKTKLAADHITSLGRVHVDTDKDGVVWLSGTVRTQAAADQALAMARGTWHGECEDGSQHAQNCAGRLAFWLEIARSMPSMPGAAPGIPS